MPRSPATPVPQSPSTFTRKPGQPLPEQKDLSFLLDPSIYHTISQLEIPPPFRQHFPPSPTATTPLSDSLSLLEFSLKEGKLLSAAFLAAATLVSGSVSPTDAKTVFELLSLRYSCLELTGNGLLAAQESKALEDLNSAFYFVDPPISVSTRFGSEQEKPLQQHIVPFPLRLQALRLQSIGFSDPRRGIAALYDLGLECRENIASPFSTDQEREVWTTRLGEIGIKVVNALVEMGDLDCASRTLASIEPSASKGDISWKTRMVLLHLKVGDLSAAHRIFSESGDANATKSLLQPLLAVADGRYEDACEAWEECLQKDAERDEAALIKQNLAVAYLYSGQIAKTKEIMDGLVGDGNTFRSLTFNLATLYELSSDRSRDLKLILAIRLAKQQSDVERGWMKSNADFKL